MCSDSRVASLHASLVLLGPTFVYTVNFGTSKKKEKERLGLEPTRWPIVLLYLFQKNKCVSHYVRLSMIVLKKKKQTVLEWLLVILGQHASCDSDHGLQAWEAETFIHNGCKGFWT